MADLAQARIAPSRVRYIKLGGGGSWEAECFDRGIIRIGFGSGRPDRLRLCQSKDWKRLAKSFIAEGKNQGTATRSTKELQVFFEDDGTTLWITFMRGCLHWGMLDDVPPKAHRSGDGVWRTVAGGWRGDDVKGSPLSKDRLSGALTKLAAYQGTSCDVGAAEYVIRRINGQTVPEVERALAVSQEMGQAILSLMRMLTPKDFELLVDLVFTTSGWRRVGVVGKTQDTVDLDLILPSTRERAFVQVKAETTSRELAAYIARLDERAGLYSRMFYVYHSGAPKLPDDQRVTVIGPEQLGTLFWTPAWQDG